MTENKEWKEYGYYEVYIPVWNPQKESQPVNLTVDIVANDEKLSEINHALPKALEKYGKPGRNMESDERLFANCLHSLLEEGLIWECYCDSFDIENPEDLKEELKTETFGIFPL